MSEEEKKAIELLKQEPDYSLGYYKREKAIDIVLNLIDRLQKELEKEKEKRKYLWNKLVEYEDLSTVYISNKNVVAKDRIKSKEEELMKTYSINDDFNLYFIIEDVLEDLLKEN